MGDGNRMKRRVNGGKQPPFVRSPLMLLQASIRELLSVIRAHLREGTVVAVGWHGPTLTVSPTFHIKRCL
jgi:hypothetical protein